MPNKWRTYLVVAVASAVAAALVTSRCSRAVDVETVTIEKRDTVTIHVIDTLEVVRPLYITETIIDTIYVLDTAKNALKMPITQKYYKGEYYEAWVSGYNPSLDKIRTFAPTEYKYITVETTKETILSPKWALYGNVEGIVSKERFCPFVSAYIITPSRFTFSAGVGYMDKGVAYKASIGYKIF